MPLISTGIAEQNVRLPARRSRLAGIADEFSSGSMSLITIAASGSGEVKMEGTDLPEFDGDVHEVFGTFFGVETQWCSAVLASGHTFSKWGRWRFHG